MSLTFRISNEVLRMSFDQLYLHEEILLWVLKNEKGTIDWRGGEYLNIMAGAIVAELLIQNKIKLDEIKKKHISLIDATITGDSILDEAIEQIKKAKKSQSIEHWVESFAAMNQLKERVADKLCHRGILKQTKEKVLFFFTETNYPETNPVPEQRIVERVRQAIVNEQAEVDLRTTILISLLYKTELLPIDISSEEIKAHKQHIEEIITGEKIGAATQEAIDAINTMMLVLTLLPMITTLTITSS